MQPIGRLFSGIDDTRPQLLQFLVDLVPVVAELFKNRRQRRGKRGLQVGVVVQFDIEVVADGMLHLRRLGLGAAPFANLLFKVLIEYGDRLDLHLDPF